jgi:hypothetical protein
MGTIPVTAALSALTSSATMILTAWLRARSRLLQARERARAVPELAGRAADAGGP